MGKQPSSTNNTSPRIVLNDRAGIVDQAEMNGIRSSFESARGPHRQLESAAPFPNNPRQQSAAAEVIAFGPTRQ